MTPPAGDRRAFVRAIVAEFAPEELPEFDLMTEAYFASPAAARRARRPRDEAGALGIDLGDPTLTNLLWNVVGGLAAEGILITARNGRSWWRRWRKNRVTGPDAPLLALTPEQRPAAQALLAGELAKARFPDAEIIAERAVDRWAKRDWTPPA
ncbi:hypothetical protein Sme01_39880 [Sphaerisporangium melleum]|uniref:Uncharacterized protein n=1 Tax=Sphaerisporangium melleum TaxID=321316 RepID=A0A917VIA2_9ACTN|nr:hypothetical protein [Sphaerisporangium melleum]GGK86432.1 hypothetical protein GCM10007964_31300 [Sphaerisporangium melleum]GII71512.1 hypothetical protein Sme01_39880 [Sphaerisporangium melleum]